MEHTVDARTRRVRVGGGEEGEALINWGGGVFRGEEGTKVSSVEDRRRGRSKGEVRTNRQEVEPRLRGRAGWMDHRLWRERCRWWRGGSLC